jgi:hypothetical protein
VLKLVGPRGFAQALAITEAIVNGGLFAAAGSRAAHYTYDIAPAITYLQQLGASLAASNINMKPRVTANWSTALPASVTSGCSSAAPESVIRPTA